MEKVIFSKEWNTIMLKTMRMRQNVLCILQTVDILED